MQLSTRKYIIFKSALKMFGRSGSLGITGFVTILQKARTKKILFIVIHSNTSLLLYYSVL